MTFVLLEVGCLECREYTTVVGVYDDGAAALAAYEEHAKDYGPDDSEFVAGEFVKGATGRRTAGYGRLQLHETEETT